MGSIEPRSMKPIASVELADFHEFEHEPSQIDASPRIERFQSEARIGAMLLLYAFSSRLCHPIHQTPFQ